jgi:hypothetical protein
MCWGSWTKKISFQVGGFDPNAQLTTYGVKKVECDHDKLLFVKTSTSKSSMTWCQQSLHLIQVIHTKKKTVEKYKIFTLPNPATPTEQHVMLCVYKL